MQPNVYISIVALVIAIASFVVSFRNAGFSRRAKTAELRATLLSKLTELSISNSRIQRQSVEFERVAREANDPHIAEMAEMPGIEDQLADVEAIFNQIESAPVNTTIASYEEHFHRLHRLAERTRELESRIIFAKKAYDSLPPKPAL